MWRWGVTAIARRDGGVRQPDRFSLLDTTTILIVTGSASYHSFGEMDDSHVPQIKQTAGNHLKETSGWNVGSTYDNFDHRHKAAIAGTSSGLFEH